MPQTNEDIPVTVGEIKALRAEISLMHASLAHDVIVHAPLVKEVSELFISKGLNESWIEKLLAPLAGSSFEEDREMLLAYVLEELDTLLSVEDEVENLENKIHILVGGTGIGKTSLIGKLGARYSYFFKTSYEVAFLNFDEDKVGAVEQLEHYSDAMEIPLLALEDLFEKEYDCILIDTAGNLGEDENNISSLIEMIKGADNYNIEISLVLSATSKLNDLERILENFSVLPIQNFIFTKLDETYDLSDMINFLIKHQKPVTYLSVGKEIPEDLQVATKEYLLNQFMCEV